MRGARTMMVMGSALALLLGSTGGNAGQKTVSGFDRTIADNASRMLSEGRATFRFDTFGDEAFWGDTLGLHRAIAGSELGGVGAGVSPRRALQVGLKEDADALSSTAVSVSAQGRTVEPAGIRRRPGATGPASHP